MNLKVELLKNESILFFKPFFIILNNLKNISNIEEFIISLNQYEYYIKQLDKKEFCMVIGFEKISIIKYILASSFDEIKFHNEKIDFKNNNKSLLICYFGESCGGEKIFNYCDEFLANETPDFLICELLINILLLGFQGKFGNTIDKKVKYYIKNLGYRLIKFNKKINYPTGSILYNISYYPNYLTFIMLIIIFNLLFSFIYYFICN